MSESEVVFETTIDKRGWTQFPNLVLLDPSLSPEARLMYALFVHYAREKKYAYPGMPTIAKVLGCTVRSATTHRRQLEKAMLLHTERRGQKQNLYTILDLTRRVRRIKQETAEARERDRKKAAQQKREADRKKTASDDRKKTTPELDLEEGNPGGGERARKRVLKIGGNPVARVRWANTEKILAEFNRQNESKYRLVTSAGQPSLAAQRIYKALQAYPDLTLEEHTDIIRRTLSSRWWGRTKASPGVVFGLKVFEDNITRDPTPVTASAKDDKVAAALAEARQAAEEIMRGEDEDDEA